MAGVSGTDVLNYLLQFVGVPYVWGGQGQGGFDCSGLMWYGYQHFGVNIPRGSNDQLAALRQVPTNQAQIGDLVFFDSDNNGRSDHVAMYAGNGMVLVADHTGTQVRVVPVTTEARITGVARPPGVFNTTTFDQGLVSATPAGLQSIAGHDYSSLVPSTRPTFDLFGQLGLQSPSAASLNENYGLSASFMESDPELANLYSQAVANTWSTDQFQAALQQTNWWQNNSDTARKLLVEKQTNPAQYQQDISNKIPELTEQATKLGVHLSTGGMNTLASMALMLNMNTATIDAYLSKYLELNQQGHFLGYAGQVELGIREYARDQGIPLTDQYVDNAVTGIIAGTDTLQNHRANIQTLAEQAFPAYADQIKQGVTVGQIAAPFLAAQAKIWETDPNKIDLFDTTLRSVLTKTSATSPTAPAEPVQVPLYDFEKTLRQDPRWLTTNNARESMTATAKNVLSNMGLVASDVGAAPTVSTSITDNSRASFGSLSGNTNFPTLQGQQYQNPGPVPNSAASLAPNTSFQAGTS
jgi:hypothetical protein